MRIQKKFLFIFITVGLFGAGTSFAQKQLLPAVRAGAVKQPLQVQKNLIKGVSVPYSEHLKDACLSWQPSVKMPQRFMASPKESALWRRLKQQVLLKRVDLHRPVTAWRKHLAAGDTGTGHLQTLGEFQETLQEIDNVGLGDRRFQKMLKYMQGIMPMREYSSVAVANNRLLLNYLQRLYQKFTWMDRYPNQGRQALKTVTSGNLARQLAARLQQEKLILLGETHFRFEVQQAVGNLIVQPKKQNPPRRTAVPSAFLASPSQGTQIANQTLETYYRRIDAHTAPQLSKQAAAKQPYARGVFQRLLQARVEVYPLEDRDFSDLLKASGGQEAQALGVSYRNKTWARIIRQKMDEIRRTDPDALFIVYAGTGHTSWRRQSPLPAFFAPEKPVVVEFQFDLAFKNNVLYALWGADSAPFSNPQQASLSYWEGADAKQLVQNSGFDYLWVLPASFRGKLLRQYLAWAERMQ